MRRGGVNITRVLLLLSRLTNLDKMTRFQRSFYYSQAAFIQQYGNWNVDTMVWLARHSAEKTIKAETGKEWVTWTMPFGF